MFFGKKKQVIVSCQSHAGMVRPNNEDSCAVTPLTGTVSALILADGMGGHSAGEIASRIFIDETKKCIGERYAAKKVDAREALVASFAQANEAIFTHARDHGKSGMGTTGVVALVSTTEAVIGWIGDSRAYAFSRKKGLSRVTSDHSLVQMLVDGGTLTPEEAAVHPRRNEITRAVGIDADVGEPDIVIVSLSPGDMILTCSDGLTGELADEEIGMLVSRFSVEDDADDRETELLGFQSRLIKLIDRLIDEANQKGGHDNVTVTMSLIV